MGGKNATMSSRCMILPGLSPRWSPRLAQSAAAAVAAAGLTPRGESGAKYVFVPCLDV